MTFETCSAASIFGALAEKLFCRRKLLKLFCSQAASLQTKLHGAEIYIITNCDPLEIAFNLRDKELFFLNTEKIRSAEGNFQDEFGQFIVYYQSP